MMRIVVLESDNQVLAPLKERCRKSGVTLDVYSALDAALKAVSSDPDSVDLILISCEVGSSQDEGYSLSARLRKDPNTSEVPFIIMSSKLGNADFAKHQKTDAGANAYLKKPLVLSVLLKTIESVTGIKFPDEKKPTVIKKNVPKPLMPGLAVVLAESRNVVRVQESVLAPMGIEQTLTFFAGEGSAEAESEQNIEQSIEQSIVQSVVQSSEQNNEQSNEQSSAVATTPTPAVASSEQFATGLEINLSMDDADLGMELESSGGASFKSADVQMIEVPLNPEPKPEPIPELEQAPTSVLATVAPAVAPVPTAVVDDEEVAQDLPYLFGALNTSITNAKKTAELSLMSTAFAQADLTRLEATDSGDIETMKKYLMMREQDIAILSAQLTYAKEELTKAEQSIKSLNMQVEDMVHSVDERNQRIETLEKELMHAGKNQESEIEHLKFELKSKVDRIKFIEDQLNVSALQHEKLRERVRHDIRKIRAREKELENKLEILKKDSETLIAGRESKILELKRKIDLLEFNYDTLQDQNESEKANVAQAHEKIAKVVKVLKLAMGIIEGESTSIGSRSTDETSDENDLKAA